jgi:hypothetical protein
METMVDSTREYGRAGLLYPMLIIAAVAVILFGVLGVVAMSGVLPRADPVGAVHTLPRDDPAPASEPRPAAGSPPQPATEKATARSGVSCCEAPLRRSAGANTIRITL